MANNLSIAYWDDVRHSWSDSLPDPDVIMASDFNGLSNGAEEIKWRNSVSRVITGAEALALYGSALEAGKKLFFEAVSLSLKDTNLASSNRAHVVKFHLARGLDEQIVTLKSYKDAGYEKVDIDYGIDKFGVIALVTGASSIKFRFEVPVTNSTEYYYWVECANSVQTIFGGSAYAMTSAETTWLNLAHVFAGTLGDHKGLISHYYDYDINEWKDEIRADNIIANDIITSDMHVTDSFTAKTISVTEDFSAETVSADVMYGDIVKGTIVSTDKILGSNVTSHASDIYAGGSIYQTDISKRKHKVDLYVPATIAINDPFTIWGSNSSIRAFPLAGTTNQYVTQSQRIKLWLQATAATTTGTTLTFTLATHYFTANGLKYLNGDLDESRLITMTSMGVGKIFDDGGTAYYGWEGSANLFDVARSDNDKVPAYVSLLATSPDQNVTKMNGFLEWESYDRYNV